MSYKLTIFKIFFQDQYFINLNMNKCKLIYEKFLKDLHMYYLMTRTATKRPHYQYFKVKSTYHKYTERVSPDVHHDAHAYSLTSRYWPTQKACIDSRVSSNCKAASKATTGSSPTNWAKTKKNKSNIISIQFA